MYKIEIKDFGENKISICNKELYTLVKPYTNELHLSFSLPNDCPNGSTWGNIYANDKIIGQIKMCYIHIK